MRRACVAGGAVMVWLSTAYPVGQWLGLRKLRAMNPELFDGHAAWLAVQGAIAEELARDGV